MLGASSVCVASPSATAGVSAASGGLLAPGDDFADAFKSAHATRMKSTAVYITRHHGVTCQQRRGGSGERTKKASRGIRVELSLDRNKPGLQNGRNTTGNDQDMDKQGKVGRQRRQGRQGWQGRQGRQKEGKVGKAGKAGEAGKAGKAGKAKDSDKDKDKDKGKGTGSDRGRQDNQG